MVSPIEEYPEMQKHTKNKKWKQVHWQVTVPKKLWLKNKIIILYYPRDNDFTFVRKITKTKMHEKSESCCKR